MKLTSLPNNRALLAEGICDLMNSEMPSRFTRATTVGPTDFKYNYVSAMPFTYQYDSAVQRMLDRNLRATSVAPSSLSSTTYADAYTRARSGGYSAFDYKVGTVCH